MAFLCKRIALKVDGRVSNPGCQAKLARRQPCLLLCHGVRMGSLTLTEQMCLSSNGIPNHLPLRARARCQRPDRLVLCSDSYPHGLNRWIEDDEMARKASIAEARDFVREMVADEWEL